MIGSQEIYTLPYNDRHMADEDLAEAERLLSKYVDDSKCGWCRKNARKIRDAAKELRAASPTALGITKEFEERIGKTDALDGLDAQKEDLSKTAERTKDFKARLGKVFDGPREAVKNRRPLGPRGERPLPSIPENRGSPEMPGLARFVTQDEVGQKQDEQMQRFRSESNRRTGPVREKFRFRLWKRMEGQ